MLTGHGKNQPVTFDEGDITSPTEGQTWFIDTNGTRYAFVNLPDSLGLNTAARLSSTKPFSFYLDSAVGTDRYALRTGITASSTKYWTMNDDGLMLTTNTKLTTFPFSLIPIDNSNGIKNESINFKESNSMWFDLNGRRQEPSRLTKGLYIKKGKKLLKR